MKIKKHIFETLIKEAISEEFNSQDEFGFANDPSTAQNSGLEDYEKLSGVLDVVESCNLIDSTLSPIVGQIRNYLRSQEMPPSDLMNSFVENVSKKVGKKLNELNFIDQELKSFQSTDQSTTKDDIAF